MMHVYPMSRHLYQAVVFVLFFLGTVVVSDAPAQVQLQAGVAKRDITPPLGFPMAGTYLERQATDIHDLLYAKALVLSDGAASVAVVTCDNIGPMDDAYREAREQIARETGIPEEHTLIHATHTHTGPVTRPPYDDILVPGIVDAVKLAQKRMQSVTIAVGTGHAENLAFYRRIIMKDGSVQFNPPYGPNLVRPAGEVDSDVGIIRINTQDNFPLATFVNFGMHVTTIGGRTTLYSADYPAWTEQVLQKMFGPNLMVMFACGAAGNTNAINWMLPREQHTDVYYTANKIGHVIGGEVIKRYPSLERQNQPVIHAARETIKLRVPDYTLAEIEKAKMDANKSYNQLAATPEIRSAMKILRIHERKGEPMAAEVQVLTIGNVALVGLPGEIFVELGRMIKDRSPFPYTYIIQNSNNSIGYVPHDAAYDQGGYEVEVSNLLRGEGERLVDTAVRLLNQQVRNKP